jgi:hypothetical protein
MGSVAICELDDRPEKLFATTPLVYPRLFDTDLNSLLCKALGEAHLQSCQRPLSPWHTTCATLSVRASGLIILTAWPVLGDMVVAHAHPRPSSNAAWCRRCTDMTPAGDPPTQSAPHRHNRRLRHILSSKERTSWPARRVLKASRWRSMAEWGRRCDASRPPTAGEYRLSRLRH